MMIRTKTKDAPATRSLTEREAAALTVRIRKAVDNVWALLLEAQEREAWKALRYATWEAYVNAEFAMSRRNSYRLLDLGRVVREIEEFVPHAAQITQRDAEAIKDDLPGVKAEIAARVDQGEAPQKAATDVIAEKRATKQAKQAEHHRQRDENRAKLPDAIKQSEAAKDAAIAAAKSPPASHLTDAERVQELEETVRILEGDIDKLKAENAKFSDMWVLYQKGGFQAVIEAKDEQIRVLNTRVSTESSDKASWSRTAAFWKKKAEELGYTSQDDVVIPLDEPAFGGVA